MTTATGTAVAELTVPVRGDLNPLRNDLATARRELEAFSKSLNVSGGAGGSASAGMKGLTRDLQAANDNARKLAVSFSQMGGTANGAFSKTTNGVAQLSGSIDNATMDFGKFTSQVDKAADELNQFTAAAGRAGAAGADALGPNNVSPPTKPLKDYSDATEKAAVVSKNLAWQQRNLSFQLLDTGQSLALGMPPLMVLLQQGPQIAQIWGTAEGGVGRAFSESGKMILGLITKFPLLTAAVAIGAATIFKMKGELEDAGHKAITFGDILTGLWKTIADGVSDAFSPIMDTLQPVWDWLVNAVHSTGNLIIKSFTDVYNDLKYIFKQIPNVVALGIASATNMVIDGINSMIEYTVKGMNAVATAINSVLSKIPGYDPAQDSIGLLDPKAGQITDRADTDRIIADMQRQLQERNDRHDQIEQGDPLGEFYDAWKENSVEAMNERLSKKKKKGSKEKEDPYEKIIRDSKQFIEQQKLEADAIGMTEEAAAALRYEQEMLNKAADAHIKLTQAQKTEIHGLAEEMAAAEQRTKDLKAAYDLGKDTFKGFFTDLKDGLVEGKSLWESFGTAAANALQKIADKLLDSALDGIFDSLWTGAGKGGGIFGSLFSWISGGHATGTQFSAGGWKMVGEQGPELMKVPGGAQVIPNNRISAPSAPSFSGAANQNVAPVIHVAVNGPNGDKQIRQMVDQGVSDALAEYDAHKLPQSMERVQANPRMR